MMFVKRSLAAAAPLLLLVAEPAAALRSSAQQAAGSFFDLQEEFEQQTVRDYGADFDMPRRKCRGITDHVEALSALVVPHLKLAFCYIPKAGCTQFKDLFNRMNHNWAMEGIGGLSKGYLASSQKWMGIKDSEMTKDKGWRFATFTRDPALRYLSAFGSTCVAVNDFGFEHKFACCGPTISDNTVSPKSIVKMFEQRAHFDAQHGLVKGEDHWSSQVEIFKQCGWDKFNPNNLDFRGDISGGNVNAQVKEMLAMVGATQKKYTDLVDRFFPTSHVGGHTSPIGDIPAEVLYGNRSTLETLKSMYADDYAAIPEVGRAFTDAQLSKSAAAADRKQTEDIMTNLTETRSKRRKRVQVERVVRAATATVRHLAFKRMLEQR